LAGLLLVVDDELADGHELDALRLRALVESVAQSAGLRCVFTGTGEEALRLLAQEGAEPFSAVILDRTFEEVNAGGRCVLQALQGREILRKIRGTHEEVSVVVLTRTDSFTEAEQFLADGADRYIVKAAFAERADELRNYLAGLRDDPGNGQMVLHVIPHGSRECDMYVTDGDGRAVLKRTRRLSTPLAQIVLGCARNREGECVEFPEQDASGAVRGLEPFHRTDIQKVVYAFNRSLVTSSGGRLQPLLHGGLKLPGSAQIQSVYGRSAFCLMIGRVEMHESES